MVIAVEVVEFAEGLVELVFSWRSQDASGVIPGAWRWSRWRVAAQPCEWTCVSRHRWDCVPRD